jgi:hypothetical protein
MPTKEWSSLMLQLCTCMSLLKRSTCLHTSSNGFGGDASLFCFFLCSNAPRAKILVTPTVVVCPQKAQPTLCACRCRRPPPKMLTAVPVRGRFERVVITTSTFFDHNLTALIETLAEKMVVSYAARRLILAPLREHRMVLSGALLSVPACLVKVWMQSKTGVSHCSRT